MWAETEMQFDNYHYYDKAIEYNDGKEPWNYQEAYCHYAYESSKESDWTFIYCVTNSVMWDVRFWVAVEDVLIISNDTGSISVSFYLIYVTDNDEFLHVDFRDINKIREYCLVL